MKHNTLSTVLLAIASMFRLGAREECHNVASTVGTHANGVITLLAEENITTRYLLVKKGSAANGTLINAAASTRPWGVILDEPAANTTAAVAVLGVAAGTLKMIAAAACMPGTKVFTAAGGKVTGTYSAGAFCVGVALTSAAADGDTVVVAHMLPLLDASGTTL